MTRRMTFSKMATLLSVGLLSLLALSLTTGIGAHISARQQNRPAAVLLRGPYLQKGTPNSVTVRWRTDVASDSRVRYGASPTTLNSLVDVAAATTEHNVTINGLTPNTMYYYSIGSTTAVLAGGDANHYFITAPTVGTVQPYRLWVTGDMGWASPEQYAVRDAFYAFNGTQRVDVWLTLGDNAYHHGTDSEFQAGVFDVYPAMLRRVVLWTGLGNHDVDDLTNPPPTQPYYQIFEIPQLGEAGGVASGTENYYSYDYGNIHFISLDAQISPRMPPSAMLTWLQNDLAQDHQDWRIVYWHHPPYSKGSHDSDTELNLVEMRTHILPILESYGVDLVLTGHSHCYERSFLLDGHYGASTTFTNTMKKDGGDGRPGGNGAYTKPSRGSSPHEGTVYVVAGSAGTTSGGPLNHPAMYTSQNNLGSLVLDIQGDRLDAKFVRETGAIGDSFTIIKGTGPVLPPTITTQPTAQTACPSGNVSFSANASGNPAPTVQWQVSTDGGANYSNVNGATSTTLMLTNLALAMNGQRYRAIFTNAGGPTTTDAALLTVNSPVSFTTQPLAQMVCPGAPVSFSVMASGTGPLTYQWRKNTNNIPGATAATYEIAATNAGDAGAYDVVVTGACGSVTSNTANLTVKAPVSITTPPANQSVCPGAPVSFSVMATGAGPLTYQWRRNGNNIQDAMGSTYLISAAAAGDAGAYDVVVTGACGSLTSASATLTLKTPVSITTPPTSQTLCAGAPVTFSVAAVGTGPLNYQWRKNTTDIPNATNSSYQLAAASVNDAGAYDVLVTGACGSVLAQAATLIVNSAPDTATPPVSQAACPGGSVTFTATANGSPAPAVQWQVSNDGGLNFTNLPNAQSTSLVLNNLSVTQNGTLYRAVFTNTCGTTMSSAATLTVHGFVLLPTTQNVNASGGSGAVTISVGGACLWTASNNAPWLNITSSTTGNGNGTVNYSVSPNTGPARNGTLTIAGQTFTVMQASGCTYAINPTSGNFPVEGGSGSVNISTDNGCGWTATSNASWLTFNGATTGNGAGQVSYTVAANPGAERSGTLTIAGQMFSVTQALNCLTQPITLSPATLPGGLAGTTYQQALSASGGPGPYNFTLIAGALPSGLSLAANGTLNGTPTATGTFPFTVRATAASGCAGTQSYTLEVVCPAITVNPTNAILPNATTGTAYQQSFTHSGGAGALTFNVSAGQLPAGLMLATNGLLSGTPTQAGTATFTVRATDANGCQGARHYTLQVNCPAITVNPASLFIGVAGMTYSQNFTQTGGSTPVTFAFQGTPIPGLTFNTTTNTLSGTPTQTGTFGFSITATDAYGCIGERLYSLVINCPVLNLAPNSLSSGITSTPYNQQLTATGGTAPYTFSLAIGTLPAGLSLSTVGLLSGTPTGAGTASFTIKATDANGCFITQSFTLVVICATLTLTPPTLPGGITGTPYSQTLSVIGGAAPYSFSVSTGTLPAGLTLSNAGALTGTPTVSGITTFTIRAMDANACAVERQYQLTLTCPTITFNPASLPAAVQWTGYQQTLAATGGVAPYTFNLAAGALPAGLALANGALAGIPSLPGNYSFTLSATDVNGCGVTRAYTLTVLARAKKSDFDGDGKTDLAYWRGATSNWAARQSRDGNVFNLLWGAGYAPYFDAIVPGDYDGDGKTDHAIWRGQDSLWYIRKSSDGQPIVQLWGANYAPYFDQPTPADFDGDGQTDIAVWRPATGTWYIRQSANSNFLIETLGQAGDVPVAADYDGDGQADIAVWRADNGTWYIKQSSGGAQTIPWGAGYAPYFDVPVVADYDGDGKADLAIWRGQDSLWYIRPSATPNTALVQLWGANYAPYNDVPVPGDYDGDGKADIAVWRPTTGMWFVRKSSDGAFLVQQHGQDGDTLVPAYGVK